MNIFSNVRRKSLQEYINEAEAGRAVFFWMCVRRRNIGTGMLRGV